MTRGERTLRRSALAAGAGLLHRAGLLRTVRYLANRFEARSNGGGRAAFPYVKRRRHGNVQILIYHRVTEKPDEFLPAMPLVHFTRQMEYLARYHRVLSLTEAVEALERTSVPDGAVVISFDDGYRDNFEHAFPVLRALSLPATIFLTTGVIGNGGLLWHDRVCRAFARTRVASFRGRALDAPGARESARQSELRDLRTLPDGLRRARIESLLADLGVEDEAPDPPLMLSWEESDEMARHGISFGAHTVTHPILSRLSLDEARREVQDSKLEIERRLGREVHAFAYPNGRAADYTEDVKRLLREAGYRHAVTTRFGTNRVAADGGWDPFELRRGGPADGNAALFAAKLSLYKFAT